MTATTTTTPTTTTDPSQVAPAAQVRSGNPLLRILGKVLAVVFAVLLLLFVLGPMVWLGISAFSLRWKSPSLLPQAWTMHWWGAVLGGNDALAPPLLPPMLLSIRFALMATALACLICLPAAYALGRANFPGRRVILLGVFATNAFPKMGLFTSIAVLFYAMHLMTTQLGVIIVQMLGTVVIMTWIPSAAFAAVPPSMIEAARDAGARPLRVFFTITLRLAAPGISVALILAFLACFDEAQGTYLVGAPTYMTMPTTMYSLLENYSESAAAVFALVLTVPSVLLLLAVRKHVMGGRLAEGFQLK